MPKKFHFRLQTVLDHRERLEELRRRDFAEANQQNQMEQMRLTGLFRAKGEGLELMRRLAGGGEGEGGELDMIRILLYYSYQFGLEKNINRQTVRVYEAEAKTEVARGELLEATKQKQVLDNLKEKHFHAYMLELDRQEQSFLDDLSLGRHVRKMAASTGGSGPGGRD
jgi:flagellar FliJ protein